MAASRIQPAPPVGAKPRVCLGRSAALARPPTPLLSARAAPLFSARAFATMLARCVLRRKARRKRKYVSYNATFGSAPAAGAGETDGGLQ